MTDLSAPCSTPGLSERALAPLPLPPLLPRPRVHPPTPPPSRPSLPITPHPGLAKCVRGTPAPGPPPQPLSFTAHRSPSPQPAGVFGSIVGVGGGVIIVPTIVSACKTIPQRYGGGARNSSSAPTWQRWCPIAPVAAARSAAASASLQRFSAARACPLSSTKRRLPACPPGCLPASSPACLASPCASGSCRAHRWQPSWPPPSAAPTPTALRAAWIWVLPPSSRLPPC